MEPHSSYVSTWLQSLRHGIFNGRAYSEHCIRLYDYQMGWFFKRFEEVSVANFKLALMQIPIERFSTRLKLFEAINCFAKFLIQEGVLEEGFLLQLKRFRPKRHLPPKKLTVDQAGLDRLLAACETPMDRLLLILLSQTGLRASEAAGLELADLHLDKRYLVVKRAKWGKTRRVGLTQTAIEAIESFLLHREHPDSSFLMTKVNGKPMDRNGILTRIYKLGRKSGVPVSPNALRRAFVTINANKGRPLPMLQIACGHSNITTTRSYCMTTEDETIEAMQGWD
ncbi:MAG TPA: tyrosine-type recombinase/integrase [Coleofasciculaceae cyanobacterium]|jgi:integrase/recombinase XerD